VKHGNKQFAETVANEEALLLANYLRNERPHWIPRFPSAFDTSSSVEENC
jgi:hypothetical protein